MNITIIIGWVICFGLVVYGILQGGDIGSFIDPSSVYITIGGTFGVLIAMFPLSILKNLPKLMKIIFLPPKYNPQKYIDDIVEYAKVARSQGLLALEESANRATDPFMKKALMLIVDANDAEKVREMLDEAIDYTDDRHSSNMAFFEKGASMAPAFGMIGTLVGLVNMLMAMGDDSSSLGPAMATALITTFYGSMLANVIFVPMEASLKATNSNEILCMQIISAGVMAIAAGSNPALIKEKLEFMLPKSTAPKEKKE